MDATITATEPLLRDQLGGALRLIRTEQRRTLADVAGRAGISVQYLSEVERGVKDPSSEVLAAIRGALGLSLRELLVLSLQAIDRAMPAAPRHLSAVPSLERHAVAERSSRGAAGIGITSPGTSLRGAVRRDEVRVAA